METFKGNGAECMVRFIADGCKGRVTADIGTETQLEMVSQKTWHAVSSMCSHSLDWLAHPCEYHKPEPVYYNASPGEALDAWLAGKKVQAQDLQEPGDWFEITTDGRVWVFASAYRYRIGEN